jgi:hypothetical protein
MEGKNYEEIFPEKCHTALFERRPQLLGIPVSFSAYYFVKIRSNE